MTGLLDVKSFINKWKRTGGSERANKDSFLNELCRALGVPSPDGTTGDSDQNEYVFEADTVSRNAAGKSVKRGRIDLYKKGCFVLEAKQGSTKKDKKIGIARRGSPGWASAMHEALGQALGYAQQLEERPPFLIVTDIGYCFDLFACFDGSGAYHPYPNGQNNRLYFKELQEHTDTLRAVWMDPHSLDPARRSEQVTREVAADLARLATDLEAKYSSEAVAAFLMRCIFTMFAQDVGLLGNKVFTKALEGVWLPKPSSFKKGVQALWDAMNKGKPFFILGKLLRFNGGLFANPKALKLNKRQLKTMLQAAQHEWSQVEPAIFGTLIEGALNPELRHKLGVHFTPRAYVERVLGPAVEEPLRGEWDLIRAQVLKLVPPDKAVGLDKVKKARAIVRQFHQRLCEMVVLDPACGSGNFLYLALNLFKRIESDVLAMLHDLGATKPVGEELMVTPKQFKGIEIRQESKEVAELVLWIGYLQWHHQMYGETRKPPEPILRDYKNIVCRDALLDAGDESAKWPEADFIVGNPPFVGNKVMRQTLGTQYVDQLRSAYPEVSEASDLVMYWWHKAAVAVRKGNARRFGLISTKAISQVFNAREVATHLKDAENPLSLIFAIPNHPWVNTSTGAAVRVAMTVGVAGRYKGVLAEVSDEGPPTKGGSEPYVSFRNSHGKIQASLHVGAAVRSAAPLISNLGMCFQGVKLVQPRNKAGFIVTEDELQTFGGCEGDIIKPYLSNRELMQGVKQKRFVIDFGGRTEQEARRAHPQGYQQVYDQVKPFRAGCKRDPHRILWWRFGWQRPQLRQAISSLRRYIVTSEVAKHRVFSFLEAETLPDASLYAVATDDAFILGVLSSQAHVRWALRAGGRMGKGDEPRYLKGPCFEPFPFPACSAVVRGQIAEVADELDQHRKKVLAKHPSLCLTALYNVLEKIETGADLTEKEAGVKQDGLVSVLHSLHRQLDSTVLAAYGWDDDIEDEALLEALVALNQERAAEEQQGDVQWLRPALQR